MTYVFVSYARSDSVQVEAWMGRLREQGVVAWKDREQIRLGDCWPKVLGDAIANAHAMLLFWSASVIGSDWVEVEWTTALTLRVPILPVLLDDTPLPPLLSATQHITVRDGADVLVAVLKDRKQATSDRTASVLRRLADLPAGSPGEALPILRNLRSVEGGVHVNVHTGGVVAGVFGLVALALVVLTHWPPAPAPRAPSAAEPVVACTVPGKSLPVSSPAATEDVMAWIGTSPAHLEASPQRPEGDRPVTLRPSQPKIGLDLVGVTAADAQRALAEVRAKIVRLKQQEMDECGVELELALPEDRRACSERYEQKRIQMKERENELDLQLATTP